IQRRHPAIAVQLQQALDRAGSLLRSLARRDNCRGGLRNDLGAASLVVSHLSIRHEEGRHAGLKHFAAGVVARGADEDIEWAHESHQRVDGYLNHVTRHRCGRYREWRAGPDYGVAARLHLVDQTSDDPAYVFEVAWSQRVQRV